MYKSYIDVTLLVAAIYGALIVLLSTKEEKTLYMSIMKMFR